MNLSFDNNWRRVLLLTKQADRNLDQPVPYIELNTKNLPCSFQKFCEQFSYDYQFDYDSKGKVLWPSNDSTPVSSLLSSLNKDFPKCASLITKKPSVIHNLSFNDLGDF